MSEIARQSLMRLSCWEESDLSLPDISDMKKGDQAKIAKRKVIFQGLYTFRVQSDSNLSIYHTVEHDGCQSISCSCADSYPHKEDTKYYCKHMRRVDMCLIQRRERLYYKEPYYQHSLRVHTEDSITGKPSSERKVPLSERGTLNGDRAFSILRQ